MALPAKAQTFGTKYAEKPSVVFQSTSTMMGSGSTYSANPTLNTDGTAYYNGAAASGPRRVKMGDPTPTPNPGDPESGDQDNTEPDPTPVGDALIPLTLLAGAYIIIRATRRKVRSRMSERCK